MAVVFIWTAMFILGAIEALGACSPDRALSEYHKQEWQVEDGLPQGNVRSIAQSPGGFLQTNSLLIGTGGGMVSFDGLRFVPFAVDSSDSAAREPVNAVLFARDGSLWIGTDDRGVIHRTVIQRTTVRSVNVSEAAGLYQERVRALFEDSAGAVWVATQNGVERVVTEHGAEKVELLGAMGIVPGDFTTPFAPDGAGGMFIVTAKGLFHWLNGTAKSVPVAMQSSATAVYRDLQGRVWVGTERGAFQLIAKGGGYTQQPAPDVHGLVASIIADRQGNVWFGTRGNGICKLSGHGTAHWTSTNGLADNTIRSMLEDNEGNVWIGMLGGGLSRWRQTALIPYGQPEGLPESYASTVLADSRGDLWLGTWGKGLFRLRQGSLEPVALPGISRQVPIRALADDRKGGIWVGTWYGGLYHLDARRNIRRFLTGTESYANAVSSLLVDRTGSLWVGTYRGILKYQSGIPNPRDAEAMIPDRLIVCLKETPSGEVLAGTSQGLYSFKDGTVTVVTKKDGLSDDAVVSVGTDAQGAIWVGTKAGGVDRIEARTEGAKAILRHVSGGLSGFPIFSILDDSQGSLWMGTPRGVIRVPRSQLHELSEGRRRTLDLELLGKSDGMRSGECVGLSQPSAALAGDGGLWFATAKGFVHTNPAQVGLAGGERPGPPPVRIAGISLDHQTAGRVTEVLSIPRGTSEVDFAFEAIRLADPAQLQFRYKLEGYDADWNLTRGRHAIYKRLPAGPFRFVVSVRDHQGPWSAEPAILAAEQLPYFYERWWFYALLATALTSVIWLLFRWRLLRARGSVALILEERNRIARDWHDTLMANFAAISWQLEATKNRLAHAPEDAASSLDLTRNMVKHCQAEARRIIWDLRAGEEPTGLLSEELSKALCTMGPEIESHTQMQVVGEERPLPPVCVHHLVCIGQEAVTNALRHAAPRTVSIGVVFRADGISMTVRDDGRGFLAPEPAHTTPGHFGLAVMHERARKIGGDLRIQSSPGAGTEISVDVASPFAA